MELSNQKAFQHAKYIPILDLDLLKVKLSNYLKNSVFPSNVKVTRSRHQQKKKTSFFAPSREDWQINNF